MKYENFNTDKRAAASVSIEVNNLCDDNNGNGHLRDKF
jgi:hypothetical protein